MLFGAKPQINLLAGWFYLFSPRYRQEIKDEWETLPGWVIATQVAAGAGSVLFPLIVGSMLAFVFITRHL